LGPELKGSTCGDSQEKTLRGLRQTLRNSDKGLAFGKERNRKRSHTVGFFALTAHRVWGFSRLVRRPELTRIINKSFPGKRKKGRYLRNFDLQGKGGQMEPYLRQLVLLGHSGGWREGIAAEHLCTSSRGLTGGIGGRQSFSSPVKKEKKRGEVAIGNCRGKGYRPYRAAGCKWGKGGKTQEVPR